MTVYIILTLCMLLAGVYSKTADQTKFPACPVNHQPVKYCCEYKDNKGKDVKILYTKFNRPSGDSAYEEEFMKGWELNRQVNFPYAKYTPNTDKFKYVDSSLCRLDRKLDSNGKVSENLVCGVGNFPPTLRNQSKLTSVFMTYPANPRNNNATCPEGGRFREVNDQQASECKVKTSKTVPKYTTYTEAPFLLVYFAYSLFFIGAFLWTMYKKSVESLVIDSSKDYDTIDLEGGKKSLTSEKHGPITPAKSDLRMHKEEYHSAVRESEVSLQHLSDDILQTGYIDNIIGSSLLYYFGFLSVGFNVIMIVIIVDYYEGFNMPLIMPGEPLLATFMTVWFSATVWYIAIVILQDKLRNFFRVKASLNECTHVHMFKPEYTEIMLADKSGISDMVEKFESFFLPKGAQKGHECTVPVFVTSEGSRVIEFQHLRYIYNETHSRFIPGTVALGRTYNDLHQESQGLTNEEHLRRLDSVGPNSIEIEMPSMLESLRDEFFTFFYIYQIMCYYVWYYFSYWNMGLVMTIVVASSAVINIVTKRRMQASVVKMTHYRSEVRVCRNGQWITVDSPDLAPGDLVKVKENWVLPCDLVIVKGATVCDESMLTGESMPVQKFPIPYNNYDEYDALGHGKKYTLFSGTKVLSSGRDEEILALVQTTGVHTSKGQLVQSILFPVPMRFKYDQHLKVLMAFLLVYGVVACYFVVVFLTSNGNLTNKLNAWAYCIFMLSGIVSPLLPVVITVGQVNASKRLEKLGVFSLNTHRIALSGKVRVFCFDKTGTLTKEGLDFIGCKPMNEKHEFLPIVKDVTVSSLNNLMRYALASCHAVGSLNGELVGNQVELKMFRATEWTLVEKEGCQPVVCSPHGDELEVVARFEFDHHRMSMSVVMRDKQTGKLYVFCKGSYEKMQQISCKNTQPADYLDAASKLAREGCYVLGIAIKELPCMTETELQTFIKNRDAVEENVSLLGLILFRNELKPDTRDAILRFKKGDTRVVMITGDNAMCGCYIARESGMVDKTSQVILGDMVSSKDGAKVIQWTDVDTQQIYTMSEVCQMVDAGQDVELAVTGKAFDYLVATGDMKRLLLHVRIYSRMSPDGKVECVKLHMDTGAVTGMCGDGGNDCGALRVAHTGIALSDAEASIVSPFTSKPKTITSVVDLCREGRCSVATSFASVKMLIMYGLIASTLRYVQYYNGVIMSEFCYILTDGMILVGLSYVITLSRPLKELGSQRPTSSLIGPTTICSILGQELINAIFLYFGIQHLVTQPWYCPFSPDNVDLAKWWLLSDNAIATCLFYCVVFQQQTAAFVFSFGSRFRLPIWRNYALCGLYVALIALDFYLVLGPPSVVTDLFRIASSPNVVGLPEIPLSFNFRVEYLGFIFGNMIAVIIFEIVFVLGPIRSYFRNKYHKDVIPMKL